jgi:hypothetical protein
MRRVSAGLRQVQLVRGFAEPAQLGDQHERLDAVEIDLHVALPTKDQRDDTCVQGINRRVYCISIPGSARR